MATAASKILIIDDDAELCRMLADYLRRFSYDVDSHTEPLAGVAAARRSDYAALVLDVMMPDLDGMEVCKRVREFSAVPILMLTARGDTADKVLGLELGADDYLAKPFEPREVAARLQALTRRASGGLEPTEGGELELVPRSKKAFRVKDGKRQDLRLSETEFVVLHKLFENRPDTVSREELYRLLHGFERTVHDRSIDMLVSKLRGKLGDKRATALYIRTVRTVGYAYIG